MGAGVSQVSQFPIASPVLEKRLGEEAFLVCTSLTSIKVGLRNTHYSSLEGVLFNKDQSTLLQYSEGKKAEEYIIPDSVTSIGAYVFSKCRSLTSITIPDSVTSIGYEAFYECRMLTSIYFRGDAPSSVGKDVFDGCIALKNIYYVEGKKGWTNPWEGVQTATWVPERKGSEGVCRPRLWTRKVREWLHLN